MDIFNELNKREVNYGVGVAEKHMRYTENNEINDYFIFIAKKDRPLVKGLKFHDTNSHKRTIDHTLTDYEIEDFKYRLKTDEFVLKSSTDGGRIYELKDKPFKEYFTNLYKNQ